MKLLLTLLLLPTLLLAYEVTEPTNNGFTIQADNFVTITTPQGKTTQITPFPFVTPNSNTAPISPILCDWNPTGRWVVIFVQTTRATLIYAYDLLNERLLSQYNDYSNHPFPSWYKDVYSSEQTPGKWKDNILQIINDVQLRNGNTRKMQELLTITGPSFNILPLEASDTPASNAPQKPMPRSLEW